MTEWQPPKRPVLRPTQDAYSPRSFRQENWYADGFVAVRTTQPPLNREHRSTENMLGMVKMYSGGRRRKIVRLAAFLPPNEELRSNLRNPFGKSPKGPREGLALQDSGGAVHIVSRARFDYVASHCEGAKFYATGAARPIIFVAGGEVVGLVMVFVVADGSPLDRAACEALIPQEGAP